MIEKIVYDFLKSRKLNANMFIPNPQPKSFYLIEKTGSSRANRIETSTIIIQSYATSLLEAAQMNEAVKSLMLEELAENTDVVSVHLNGDYNFTDTTTKSYRYQAVFLVVHY